MIEQLAEAVSGLINDHWAKLLMTLLAMGVGFLVANWRARQQWRKREFYARVNVSLNRIEEGVLHIRTVLEDHIDQVFLNKAAAEMVTVAARKTSEENPIIELPDEDRWFVHNEVLNQLAEHFSTGELRRDLGLPTQSAHYVLALTCERAGDMRTHKIRAMLIRRDALVNFEERMPELEHSSHKTRFKTLKVMAHRYRANPGHFIDIELTQ